MVQIIKMIVHDINLVGKKPHFSNSLINIDEINDKETALSFFTEHITNNRTQSTTKKCYFDDSSANHVKIGINSIANIFKDQGISEEFDEVFIEESKRFVSDLRNKMIGKSQSNGALFVLFYKHKNQYFVGLLKMDPNNGIKVNDDLTITVIKDLVPSPGEKLHKSAFVKLEEEFKGRDLHLFVLDRQQSKDKTAKYFMRDFLNAHEIANNTNLTPLLEKTIKKEFFNIVPENELFEFFAALKRRLSSGRNFNLDVDLPPLVKGFIEEGYDITNKIQKIKNTIWDEYEDAVFDFPPDPNMVKPTVFKTPNDEIVITVKNEVTNEQAIWTRDEDGNFIIKIYREKLEVKQTK